MTPADSASILADPSAAKRRRCEPSAAHGRRARARLLPRRRLRANRAADPAPGGDLSRHVGRGSPPPPVPHRRRRRRGAVPAGPNIRSPSAALIWPRTRPAESPNIPISARFFALARARAASRRRPGSRASAAATPKRPTRRCSRSRWRRRPRRAGPRSRRGSATPACSTRVLDSLEIPEPWRRRLRRGVARGLEPRGHFHCARARARSPSPACWRRWRAPTTPAPRRWSRTCSRSPASTRSAGARQARSPTASSNRPRCRSGPPIEAEKRAALDAFLAISGDPDQAAIELRRLAAFRRPRP